MAVDGSHDFYGELNELVWRHIRAKEFELAEPLAQQLIDITDSEDCQRRWHLLTVLAGILTELKRPEEATTMLRRALLDAQRSGPAVVEHARYLLADHLLVHGDPGDALLEAEPIPSGVGQTQCLLHAVVALAHWKLGHHVEAKAAAGRALDTAPTAERKQGLTEKLQEVLSSSGVGFAACGCTPPDE